MAANPKGHASFNTFTDLIDSGEEETLSEIKSLRPW